MSGEIIYRSKERDDRIRDAGYRKGIWHGAILGISFMTAVSVIWFLGGC